MPAVNSIINKADYNSIRDSLVDIMGNGSGTTGWGQQGRIRSSAVTESNPITINEWGNLRFDVINAYTHIFGSTPTTAQVVEGNTIRYSSSFTPDSGTLDTPVGQYLTWVNTIVANKFTVAAGQSAATSTITSSREWPGIFGNTWTSKIACTVNLSWSSANQARYFFNSGGLIRLASSRANSASSTLGGGNQQNIAWTSILSTAGTRSFGGNTPASGTSPSDAQNFYRLTNSYQAWYTASGSSPYGANSYRISARCNVANNTTGTATSVDFLLEFIDNYTDSGGGLPPPDNPLPGDAVDGIFSVSASTLYATGIMIPTGTGNFVVETPTVTVSGIAPA
jgi:hypothetical protein